mgnify:CR=1 FL=1
MTNDRTTYDEALTQLREEFPTAPHDILEALAEFAAYPLEDF